MRSKRVRWDAAMLRVFPFVLLTFSSFLTATARADDQAPFELVQTIVLKGKPGKLDHVAVDAKRGRLLLANKVNNTLDVVDLQAGKLLRQIPSQQGVQGIAIAPDLDRVYAALGEGGFCNVFDANTYKLLKTIKFKDDADNARYDPRTHQVYVAHAEKSLAAIDAKSLAVRMEIGLPGSAEGFEMETGKPRLYVNVPPNQMLVIDTDKNAVIETYTLSLATNNVPLALDEANHRVFVGCRKEPMVLVLDAATGKEITSVPIPGGIDDLTYDSKRKLLYASCGDGYLAVIKQQDADHYAELAKIPTAAGAKTHYFDPDTGRLYLGVPRQEGKPGPEIRVYQAK
ncbi:MAG TPA: YncE family protein [Gemmataceae bacterium]|nr:YncE family protein [Gemmataceae bacterium]